MSKIGKKNIVIPKESSIKIEGANLTISGPKGTKKLTINDKIFSSNLKLEMKWIKLILILILVEIIAGASMYYFSFPILSQPLHLFIAILIFGFQFNWYLNIKD